MYQRILVPINESTTSERALQEAIRLAGGKSVLRLVYVLEEVLPVNGEGYDYANSSALHEAALKTGNELLAQAAKKVQLSGASVETTLLDELGLGVVDAINNEAINWRADLIVIGTHGRTGLTRLLLGSVAEGVVREASMPVLLIRA
jgi:nucleotide-binding universal stress UspA family protein